MADPTTYHFQLPPDSRPPFHPLNEQAHPEFGWMTKNRARSRGGDVFEIIDVVVVHATAGFATQHAIDHWKRKDVKASAHWIVPDEDEPQHEKFVWAVVGEAKAAYHVGAKGYAKHIGAGPNVNNRSLGIEIVNSQNVKKNVEDPYSDWQVRATAEIITYAWAKYPNLKHVISHAKLDPKNRSDPGSGFPWSKLEELVLTHAVLPAPNPLVTATPAAKAPEELAGNCCEP